MRYEPVFRGPWGANEKEHTHEYKILFSGSPFRIRVNSHLGYQLPLWVFGSAAHKLKLAKYSDQCEEGLPK